MTRILLAGLGGFLGSAMRYLFSGIVQQWTHHTDFPYGTLAVNIIGCLFIGFFSELSEAWSVFTAETRVFVLIGLLGGFTTFSAFGNETFNLFRDGEWTTGFLNIAIQMILGLGAVWTGRNLVHFIWR